MSTKRKTYSAEFKAKVVLKFFARSHPSSVGMHTRARVTKLISKTK